MGWGVQAALGQFDELMGEMSRRQITLGEKTKGGFREIVKRTTGRYEMLYGMDTGIFDASPRGRLGQVLEGSWLGEFLAATMGPDWRLMACCGAIRCVGHGPFVKHLGTNISTNSWK